MTAKFSRYFTLQCHKNDQGLQNNTV